MADAEVDDQVVRFMNQIPLAKEFEDDERLFQYSDQESDVSSIEDEGQGAEEAVQDNILSTLMGVNVSS